LIVADWSGSARKTLSRVSWSNWLGGGAHDSRERQFIADQTS
jgi:hypothetical protein